MSSIRLCFVRRINDLRLFVGAILSRQKVFLRPARLGSRTSSRRPRGALVERVVAALPDSGADPTGESTSALYSRSDPLQPGEYPCELEGGLRCQLDGGRKMLPLKRLILPDLGGVQNEASFRRWKRWRRASASMHSR
jgi:hypothetical protein